MSIFDLKTFPQAQSDILELLKGKLPFMDEGDGTQDLASDILTIPLKKCDFVMYMDFGKYSVRVLLKYFSIPEFGVNWEMSSENMWYPVPVVEAKSTSIEGYFHRNFSNTLYKIYQNQFSNGLLNLKCKRFNVRIRYFAYKETPQIKTTSLDKVTSVARKIEGAVSVGATVGSNIGASSGIVGAASSIAKVTTDAIGATHDKKIKARMDIMYQPIIGDLCQLKGCCINNPTFDVDPSSNDLITLRANISYVSGRFNVLKRTQMREGKV